jgi:hypothetical protein
VPRAPVGARAAPEGWLSAKPPGSRVGEAAALLAGTACHATDNAVYRTAVLVGHARTVVHLYSCFKVAMCGFQQESCLVCITSSCFHKAGNLLISEASHWSSAVLLPPA